MHGPSVPAAQLQPLDGGRARMPGNARQLWGESRHLVSFEVREGFTERRVHGSHTRPSLARTTLAPCMGDRALRADTTSVWAKAVCSAWANRWRAAEPN